MLALEIAGRRELFAIAVDEFDQRAHYPEYAAAHSAGRVDRRGTGYA